MLFTQENSLQLYHAVIYPHLLYAIPIWGSTYKSYLHNISILQDITEFQGKPFLYQPKGLKTEQT